MIGSSLAKRDLIRPLRLERVRDEDLHRHSARIGARNPSRLGVEELEEISALPTKIALRRAAGHLTQLVRNREFKEEVTMRSR